MCNKECNEVTPCCLCQWNREPYKCEEKKCGKTADFCQHDDVMFAETEALYSQEPPEPPYNYVKITEEVNEV